MKTLILVRHAKSSWNLDAKDFDRPLTSRGATDAEAMAKRLIKKKIDIELFVSSPAKRALTTAGFFTEVYQKKVKNILTISSLYEPLAKIFNTVIEQLDDDFKTVAIFSHNPAITEFANQLTSVKIDDMPTSAVFAVKADIKTWKEFSSSQKEFYFFDYPKAI